MDTINAFARSLRAGFRYAWCLCLFFLSYLPVFGQSGAGSGNAVPIAVSDCGTVNFYDIRNSSYGYFDSFGHVSPEVWYTFTTTSTLDLGINLCGSDFDTYLYVLDQNLNIVLVNDDNGPLCSGLQSSVAPELSVKR